MEWPTGIDVEDVRVYVTRFLEFCNERLAVLLSNEYPFATTPAILPVEFRTSDDPRSKMLREIYMKNVRKVFVNEPLGGIYGSEVTAVIEEQHKQFQERLSEIVEELAVRKPDYLVGLPGNHCSEILLIL